MRIRNLHPKKYYTFKNYVDNTESVSIWYDLWSNSKSRLILTSLKTLEMY